MHSNNFKCAAFGTRKQYFYRFFSINSIKFKQKQVHPENVIYSGSTKQIFT